MVNSTQAFATYDRTLSKFKGVKIMYSWDQRQQHCRHTHNLFKIYAIREQKLACWMYRKRRLRKDLS